MPPKPAAGGKKTAKELEIEQREEERALLLSNLSKENERYGIRVLFPGCELVFTTYMVEQAWDHEDPVTFLKECLYYQLSRANIDKSFKVEEINCIANFQVYLLIFAKDTLKLDDYNTSVLMSFGLNLFKYNDQRFENIDFPIWSEEKLKEVDEVENLDEWIFKNTPKVIFNFSKINNNKIFLYRLLK